jgi:molybdate transport system substrate-binding protein
MPRSAVCRSTRWCATRASRASRSPIPSTLPTAGDNVAQAAAFVDSGAAQAGLVAHALLLSPPLTGKGASTLIPETWHSRLEQALVITRRAAGNALAHAFVRHLEAPATRALLARHGFSMPGER